MATTSLDPSDHALTTAMQRAVEEVAGNLREQFITAAVAAYERELREKVAQTAMTLARFYDMQRQGDRLVITVRIGDLPK